MIHEQIFKKRKEVLYFQKLSWNTHKINHFKANSSSGIEYIHSFVLLLISSAKIFSSPKGNSYPLSSHSPFPFPPSFWQPPICFQSLRLYLYCVFHINGIIQLVTFCVWLAYFTHYDHILTNSLKIQIIICVTPQVILMLPVFC